MPGLQRGTYELTGVVYFKQFGVGWGLSTITRDNFRLGLWRENNHGRHRNVSLAEVLAHSQTVVYLHYAVAAHRLEAADFMQTSLPAIKAAAQKPQPTSIQNHKQTQHNAGMVNNRWPKLLSCSHALRPSVSLSNAKLSCTLISIT